VFVVAELDSRAQEHAGYFLAEAIQLLGERLKKAMARPADVKAGADPMADVEVLLVVDDLATREMYRIWSLAGEETLRSGIVFSIHAFSVKDFKQRINLPWMSAFLAEGVDYDLR